ncbi:MAG TPA: tetraacyldisaccharide 4'-kinase [Pyrinomonadaceae bacterium]|nr:tetraacyldisaccharide 4'-kinase [Pyrinomonadaceae bacterium]
MLDLLAPIYKAVIQTRNALYRRRVFDAIDLGALTVSVGNITTGGTGKTPLVAHIAEILAANREKVCILTRGYGRSDPKKRVLVSEGEHVLVDAKKGGDEPVELATRLLGKAIVIADADRASAGEWAKRKFGVTAFVLDDGFQHRKVKRDLDIVCIDATQPLFDGKLLPAGRLREPVDSLERADAIVITRSDQAADLDELQSRLAKVTAEPKVFVSRTEISRIRPLDSEEILTEKRRAVAFCALGNADAFFAQIKEQNIQLVGQMEFRDHHRYLQNDITEIEKLAQESNAEILVTTAKDAVKLRDLKFEIPCYVAEIETKIDDDVAFREMISSKFDR